jgi:carboxymethylenebutenolidase
MSILSEWVRYGENKFSGFLAWPDRVTSPLPAVVVIQEAGGVDEQIENVTRRMAAAGYLALAPDLFAVNGARPAHFTRERLSALMRFFSSAPAGSWADPVARDKELAKLPREESGQVRETLEHMMNGGLDLEQYLPHLKAAVAYLRHDNTHSRGQKVGVMGFCMGGGLSALLAGHDTELAAAVIFYGRSPSPDLISRIKCPVLGFYGGDDKRITDTVPAFADSMKAAGKNFEFHVYTGVGHAFFNEDRPPYDVAAARDSFSRLIGFFHRHLA